MEPLPTRPHRLSSRRGGGHPAQWVVGSYLAAILVGTVLLSLPAAHAPGREVGVVDALFTATSAVCVTGLVVVDTGADFSRFGQVVVLILIQIGGLGILTLGAVAAMLIGGRVGFRQRMRLSAQFTALHVGGVVRLVRRIVALVLVAEALTLLAMWPGFAARHGGAGGLWHATFHAVSAFNNAGFSTYRDSLSGFAGDLGILGALMVAFVAGGIGYQVLIELGARLRGARRHLALHARMALWASLGLLVFGALAVALLEWRNPATLGALDRPDRLLAALFEGATPRTAGFSTVDHGQMRPATLMVTMLLMFVGGSPGSTAGGIKTVTFFVLAGSAWSLARGRGELRLAGRRLTRELVVRASVVAFLSAMTILVGFTVLLVLEEGLGFLPLAFESVSAFGTVGLSMGVTAELGTPARLVVAALMLVGRLGPLTAALALVETHDAHPVSHPSEDVMVG